jgi:hypothetical protein
MLCPTCKNPLAQLFTSFYCPTCEAKGSQASITPLPQGEVVYADDFADLVRRAVVNSKKIYLNEWTWGKFLVGEAADWIDATKGLNGSVGSALTVDFYIHSGLHNREIRVVPR